MAIHETHSEIGDLRAGIRVYPASSANPSQLSNIPFGQRVQVVCRASNFTGIPSINALYLIATPPWRGLFAAANQFANGARLGVSTNEDPIDSRLPRCPSG